MALYTAEAVRDNIRNREGRRVFYLGKEDRLTPGARAYLERHQIPLLPAEQARPACYRDLLGGQYETKPEELTHLHGDVLVPKTHPRIAFRGKMDSLQSLLLLAEKAAVTEGYRKVGEELAQCLELTRSILACDVLEEPLGEIRLGGLTEAELRARSHRPQDYYDQPHFMPHSGCAWTLLLVNRARAAAREGELALCRGFRDPEGRVTRKDLLRAMNRLSSFLWILEIRLESGKEESHGTGTETDQHPDEPLSP